MLKKYNNQIPLAGKLDEQAGQVMMIVVMVLSAVIIGATGIAGILTARQTRQTADAGNFSKVLFAADSGFEWAKYKFFKDGYTCVDKNNNKKKFDCSAPNSKGEACDLKPDLSSSGIELVVSCEEMDTTNKTCQDQFDCWTITSSVKFKDTAYIFSRDISVAQ